eukprot:m.290761 g.290761  ORF g.290761 m.290761 type:complete len:130 (+) comp19471_c0_seq2:679-1068(+)
MRKRTVATAAAALTDASAPSAASAADETVSDETSSGMEQDPKHTDGVAADSGIEQPRPKQPPVDRKVTVKINVALVLLTLAAVATRMWRIGTPSKVVCVGNTGILCCVPNDRLVDASRNAMITSAVSTY